MADIKNHVFEKLTPVLDSELGVYEEAIDFAFKNEDVKNIAVSGAYGAGKSSVIETYKNKHREKKFVHISLAHFNDSSESKESTKESVLEGKILNQLIHQIPSWKIPQTNFRVKSKIGLLHIFFTSFLLMITPVLFIFFFAFENWEKMVDSLTLERLKRILSFTTKSEVRLIIGFVALIITLFLTYRIIKLQINKHIFRKFSVQGNEIEIFQDSNDSFFDKYLNEVLYLFENVKADAIVFEDIDRFEDVQIFERLREVNTLANIQRVKKRKSIIRFFYLIRDDIFTSKDRTKFFDFIIPIVPVVDGSNSYNLLIALLSKNNLRDKFDDGFLQGISLYVDDMRLLKNICNEFQLYYDRLNATELNPNKMLALIVYKNLFPKDYNNSQLNKGFVSALFNSKETLISKIATDMQEQIKAKQDLLNLIKNEHLISIEELNDAYATKLNRDRYNQEAIRKHNEEKARRRNAIEIRNQKKVDEVEQDLFKMNRELQGLSNSHLYSFFTRENIDSIFSNLEVKNEVGKKEQYLDVKRNEYFDLLKFLIRNGYIDEDYPDYMTYFYENSLSRTDKIFLRSVTDKKAKECTYPLDKPKMVFEKLKPIDFEQPETLNNSLVDYLLKYKINSEHLSRLIEQIKNTRNYVFLQQFLDVTSHKQELICALNNGWPEAFSEALDGEMDSEHIFKFSRYLLYYSDDVSLQKANIEGVLTNYISQTDDYLAIENPDIEALIHGFSVLGVYFSSINYSKANKALFDAVYQAGEYAINFENIKLMLFYSYGETDEEKIKHETTTLIWQNKETPLAKKIKKDMEVYLRIIFAECGNSINDDEVVAIGILNDEGLDVQIRKEYAKMLKTKISELTALKNTESWSFFVQEGVIAFSEENVIKYYQKQGKLDSILIKFINNAPSFLDFSKIKKISNEEKEKMFNDITVCKELNNEKYERALISFHLCYTNFSFAGIPDDKMKILIENNIIRMNEQILVFIRSTYPKITDFFIRENIIAYVDMMKPGLFSQKELLSVLSMDVEEENKLKLLAFSTTPISIIDKNYTLLVREYILKNNLDANDLSKLFETYSQLEPEIQKIVLANAETHMSEIIEDPNNVDRSLKNDIIALHSVTNGIKEKMILADFSNLDQETAVKYLSQIGKVEYGRIFTPKAKPRFEDTPDNRAILDKFIENGWIHEYYSDSGFLKIRRHAPKVEKALA